MQRDSDGSWKANGLQKVKELVVGLAHTSVEEKLLELYEAQSNLPEYEP